MGVPTLALGSYERTKVDQASRGAAQMEGAGQMEPTGSKQEASAAQGSRQEGSVRQRGRPSNALQMRTSNLPLPALLSLSPFAIVRRLMEDMGRMFEQFGSGPGSGPEAGMGERSLQRAFSGVWSPAVEVFERDGQFAVRADLPGLTPENVTIETSGDSLIIQGERQSELNVEEQGVYRAERSYGRFSRIIPLPEGADVEHATARFDNGVLEVSVPVSGACARAAADRDSGEIDGRAGTAFGRPGRAPLRPMRRMRRTRGERRRRQTWR
jgi:HSP20 family protein